MIGRSSTAVKAERTGWRDLELSRRHRLYGFDVPAVDIDFLLCEYDQSKATALIEFKHERAGFLHPVHPNYQALIDLADRAEVPIFASRYAADFSAYCAIPLNGQARSIMPKNTRLTERQWVEFLHRLRGRTMPAGLFDDKGILLTAASTA
jgi:hypothetical protein